MKVAWYVFMLVVTQIQGQVPDGMQSDALVVRYLAKYGFFNATSTTKYQKVVGDAQLKKAIKDFQTFNGLKSTGVLDAETRKLMSLPRCGLSDLTAIEGSRWTSNDLTYRVTKYPEGLPRAEVDNVIRQALSLWSEVTNLRFTQLAPSASVNIDIRFERGSHNGCATAFDGPGGVLAHAYYPQNGGTHFDAMEHWTLSGNTGTNFFQVAAHEFGHALGLGHIPGTSSALMSPYYQGYNPNQRLHPVDIQAIQKLYGPRSSRPVSIATTPRTTTSSYVTTSKHDRELCDSRFDTMFTDTSANTFVFKGDKYWMLSRNGIAPGYPRSISKTWIGLPGNIDAAFLYRNSKTYFFKGSQYWRYTGVHMDLGYPKLISVGFAGIPNSVDTAFVWSGNGRIYFFKGQHFWRFDPTQRPPVLPTYPQLISFWTGLPSGNINAGLNYTDGYTYFFQDRRYYRFEDQTFKVPMSNPPYPREVGPIWFGCPSAHHMVSAPPTPGTTRTTGVQELVGPAPILLCTSKKNGKKPCVEGNIDLV